MEEITYRSKLKNLTVWLIIFSLLYIVSLENSFLYHSLMELFSVLIAFIVFFTIWNSKGLISNRYLIFLGTVYIFIGIFDFIHLVTYRGLENFPSINPNTSMQLYLIARYLESTSFLIAPLFFTPKDYNNNDSMLLRNSPLIRRILIIYAIITACLLISVLYLKNFPICYIVSSGDTKFYEISEYIISFTLLGSLVLLYNNRGRFKTKVFELLSLSIIFTLLGEMPYLTYSHMNEFPLFIGHFFKAVSFYYLYSAFYETGLELPFSSIFWKNKQREDILKHEANFLTKEQNIIYSLLGEKKSIPETTVKKNLQMSEDGSLYLMQNISGVLFQLDKDFLPVLIEGSIEEITGYSEEDFLSGNVKWVDLVIPKYLPIISRKVESIQSKLNSPLGMEYQIQRKYGEIRWVSETLIQISGNNGKFQGTTHDITPRKKIEENLKKQEEARIREIHHRIKNNLQIISSLLDLQAEKFDDKNVIEAFKESQNRVISMALIHEELYESKDMITLNFASYLQKLVTDLLNSYTVKDHKSILS